jgi:hypothetical protein
MTEVIIGNLLWVQVMYSNIHVQTSLHIVLRNTALLEVISRTTHAVRNSLIPRRHPTALHLSPLLLIPILLLIFTEHSRNSLDSLLRVNLLIFPCRSACLIELAQSPTPH